MNRAPVNAFNTDFMNDVIKAIGDCEKDKDVKAIIMATSNKSIFSAGLQLSEMYQKDDQYLRNFWSAMHEMWLSLYSCSLPTAAAITGHAPAGGTLIAVCSDYRVMQRGKFTIGLNEAKFGLVPPFFLVDAFTNCIGQRNSELACMLGKLHRPEEAIKIGLVDELADSKEETMDKCRNMLGELLQSVPEARAMTKMLMRRQTIERFEKLRKEDLDNFVRMVQSDMVQNALGIYIQSLKKK
jgi:3,2-trans-enoyl-CoA isomerase